MELYWSYLEACVEGHDLVQLYACVGKKLYKLHCIPLLMGLFSTCGLKTDKVHCIPLLMGFFSTCGLKTDKVHCIPSLMGFFSTCGLKTDKVHCIPLLMGFFSTCGLKTDKVHCIPLLIKCKPSADRKRSTRLNIIHDVYTSYYSRVIRTAGPCACRQSQLLARWWQLLYTEVVHPPRRCTYR